jgi:hypothetical protein
MKPDWITIELVLALVVMLGLPAGFAWALRNYRLNKIGFWGLITLFLVGGIRIVMWSALWPISRENIPDWFWLMIFLPPTCTGFLTLFYVCQAFVQAYREAHR